MSGPQEVSDARSYGRSARQLALAFGFAGGLIYVYFALASHNLDPEDYGQLVVLWTVVYVIAVTLFRPVEQFLAHALARPPTLAGERARILRVAAAIQLGVTVLVLAVLLGLRERVEGSGGLLEGDTEYLVLLSSLVALAAWFVMRGLFAGLRRFRAFAAVMLLDAIVRVALALALAVGLTDDRDIALIAIAAAPLASLLILPLVLVRWRIKGERPVSAGEPPRRAEAAPQRLGGLAEGGAFTGALLVVLLCEQVILSAGPLFVKAVEGSAAAALTFNLLMIARAPLLLFQAIATSMLPHLTEMWASEREGGLDAFRRSLRGTVGGLIGFTAVLITLVAAVGPTAMELAFGDAYSYERAELILVAFGTGLYLAAVALNQAVLAQGQVRRCAACWIASAGLFTAINLIPGIDPIVRVEIAFFAVAALLCVSLLLISRRPHPRETDEIRPGSARELETILAEEI